MPLGVLKAGRIPRQCLGAKSRGYRLHRLWTVEIRVIGDSLGECLQTRQPW